MHGEIVRPSELDGTPIVRRRPMRRPTVFIISQILAKMSVKIKPSSLKMFQASIGSWRCRWKMEFDTLTMKLLLLLKLRSPVSNTSLFTAGKSMKDMKINFAFSWGIRWIRDCSANFGTSACWIHWQINTNGLYVHKTFHPNVVF